MIYSMTGFGSATTHLPGKTVSIEIKSLNSKQSDIHMRMPSLYKSEELTLRNAIVKALKRGKVECTISVENHDDNKKHSINDKLFLSYLETLKSIEQKANITNTNYTSTILSLPEVVKSVKEEISLEEKSTLLDTLKEALVNLNAFRQKEGATIEEVFLQYISSIEDKLAAIPQYEQERIDTVKNRIEENIKEVSQKDQLDQNRLEQELIYYIEKFDISEEKTRLKAHCSYFRETLNAAHGQGKKLGFIVQEIGREINTIGSKAHHLAIQKLVVDMKDELEKIKEQILNTL